MVINVRSVYLLGHTVSADRDVSFQPILVSEDKALLEEAAKRLNEAAGIVRGAGQTTEIYFCSNEMPLTGDMETIESIMLHIYGASLTKSKEG